MRPYKCIAKFFKRPVGNFSARCRFKKQGKREGGEARHMQNPWEDFNKVSPRPLKSMMKNFARSA
jgi:hypothetical protein